MDKALERQSTAMELLENMFDVEMRFLQSGSGSIEMLTGAFHRDVVVHEPQSLPYAGDWSGLEGIAALFHKMQESWSNVAVENLQAAQNDDVVFMSCTLSLTSRSQWRDDQAAVCRSPALQGWSAVRRHAVLLRHQRDPGGPWPSRYLRPGRPNGRGSAPFPGAPRDRRSSAPPSRGRACADSSR